MRDPVNVYFKNPSSKVFLPKFAEGSKDDLLSRPVDSWMFTRCPLIRSVAPSGEFAAVFQKQGWNTVMRITVVPYLSPAEEKEYLADPVAFRKVMCADGWAQHPDRVSQANVTLLCEITYVFADILGARRRDAAPSVHLKDTSRRYVCLRC